jgi:hypothetical protein
MVLDNWMEGLGYFLAIFCLLILFAYIDKDSDGPDHG